MIQNYRSYNVEVVNANHDEKIFELKVNGNNYSVQLKDQYDELLHRLGMDATSSKKVNDLKAPMPGLVTAICVEEGQAVKKGDVLVTLEAMKMENTLKGVTVRHRKNSMRDIPTACSALPIGISKAGWTPKTSSWLLSQKSFKGWAIINIGELEAWRHGCGR